MKRIRIALALAGTLTAASLAAASLAIAQTPEQDPAAAPAAPSQQQNQVEPDRGDCVDLSDATRTETVDEMAASLAAPADGDARPDSGEVTAAEGESESETQPVAGPDAGTAPGGSGSTAWTGGLGGSDIGTSQAEELDTSPDQDHPAVAGGLDPISGETAIEGPQAPAEERPASSNC